MVQLPEEVSLLEWLAGGDWLVGGGTPTSPSSAPAARSYWTRACPRLRFLPGALLPVGRDAAAPAGACALRRTPSGATPYASWNGAAQVARWELLAAAAPRGLARAAVIPRAGLRDGDRVDRERGERFVRGPRARCDRGHARRLRDAGDGRRCARGGRGGREGHDGRDGQMAARAVAGLDHAAGGLRAAFRTAVSEIEPRRVLLPARDEKRGRPAQGELKPLAAGACDDERAPAVADLDDRDGLGPRRRSARSAPPRQPPAARASASRPADRRGLTQSS